MARLKLRRFKVHEPELQLSETYLRIYDSKTLYFAPDSVPAIDSGSLFGNERLMVFDLGCGRGEFLVREALQYPELNFVGFDTHRKSLWDSINRASKAKVTNVRFLMADLRYVLFKVPDKTVQEIFMLFPPPIMKVNRLKEDFFSEQTLRHIHRILIEDGLFHFVTDNPPYYEAKLAMMDESGLFTRCGTSQQFEGGITRFQKWWEGHGIESLRFEYKKN